MATKKAPARKPTTGKRTAEATANAPVAQKMTRSVILEEIADRTNLSRSQVAAVLSELENLMERQLKRPGVGEFTLPGLLRVRAVKRPATKKRMGRNPATGEEIVIPAKPATTRVRITPLKRLKEAANRNGIGGGR